MARRCQITGKGVLSGNNVSHANNKTRRRFYPNLRKVSFVSDALGKSVQLRLSANAIRTIEFHGGLDAYVTRTAVSDLHPKIAYIKKLIAKKQSYGN